MKKKLKRAQSIIEYLGVATVFTAAGILFFTAANKDIILYHRGLNGDVSPGTLIGDILGPNNAQPWPDTPGWDPTQVVHEIELNTVGYCHQLTDEDCIQGEGTQGEQPEEE